MQVAGIHIFVRDVQPLNAVCPIFVNPLGKAPNVTPVQPLNVSLYMIFIPLGSDENVMKTNKAWCGNVSAVKITDRPNAEQFDETTDTVSKWLGSITGTSPYKINYLIDQYSGVLGDIVLPYLTPKAEAENQIIAPCFDLQPIAFITILYNNYFYK